MAKKKAPTKKGTEATSNDEWLGQFDERELSTDEKELLANEGWREDEKEDINYQFQEKGTVPPGWESEKPIETFKTIEESMEEQIKGLQNDLGEMKSTTFEYQSANELPKLYQRMNGKFIEETSYLNFKIIFSGEPIANILNRLVWIGKTSSLTYFIYLLRTKLSASQRKDRFWKITEDCFFEVKNLRMTFDNTQNNKTGKPKNYSDIDELFKDL